MKAHKIFLIRSNEYKNKVIELKRNLNKNDKLKFKDGTYMYPWFIFNSTKINFERKNNILPNEERMDELIAFSKIFDTIFDLTPSNEEVNKKKHIEFLNKAKEYFEKVEELKRNLSYQERFKFTDGTYMYPWFISNSSRIMEEYKYKIVPDNDRMEELIAFAEIENKLFDLKKIKTIDEKEHELFLKKAKEYYDNVNKHKKKVSRSDKYEFSDKKLLYFWYINTNYKICTERRNNITINDTRMEELMAFAQIDDLIYEINKENKKTLNK